MKFKTITVKADIHPDGDIYVYSKKDKKFHYVGMVVNNMKEFMVDDDGDIISAAIPNPVYLNIKKLTP